MKREMGVDREGEEAVSNHGLPCMDLSCQLLLYRSCECDCSGVRSGWFMSCFWLQTDVESCQISCCLIILVWRVRHCDSDYTHTNIHTETHKSCNRHSNTFIDCKNTYRPRYSNTANTPKHRKFQQSGTDTLGEYSIHKRYQVTDIITDACSPGSPHLAACLFSLVCQIAKAIESQQKTDSGAQCV